MNVSKHTDMQAHTHRLSQTHTHAHIHSQTLDVLEFDLIITIIIVTFFHNVVICMCVIPF